MKKLFAFILAALAFTACSTDDEYSLDYFTQKYGNNGSSEKEDPEAKPTPESDTLYVAIAYNGTSATLTGDIDKVTVSQNGADVTITSETEKYLQLTLSGSTTDGSLLVYSNKAWGLILNGVSIINADGPAINNQCSKWLYVTLAEGTENTLTDGQTYAEQTYDQKGTFFSEGQMQFLGNGTLTINSNAKNGIASDDYIMIDEGNISINTSDTLVINVKSDGGRGIRCEARTTFNGGETTITTSGDCAPNDDGSDTSSAAGIKCDSLFTMTDGTLTIKSSGDGGKGINCNENVEIKGGTLTVTTTGSNEEGKPKGIKSDTGIIISGGSLTVSVKKSWALDNGVDSDDPEDRIKIEGTPVKETVEKRSVIIQF